MQHALPPRVVYVSSPEARSITDRLPSNIGRSSIVHSLIESLELLTESETDRNAQGNDAVRARVALPLIATCQDLLRYHSPEYIDTLFNQEAMRERPLKRDKPNFYHPAQSRGPESDSDDNGDEVSDFGLEDDCPIFDGLEEYCKVVAGGSLTAAREIRDGRADIAIYWDGGRHHATKSKASGFCYVNDIILAIIELQRPSVPSLGSEAKVKRLSKIMYLDLDLHHGDGVAEAFSSNKRVLTLSCHLWSRGFYPSSPEGQLAYTGPRHPAPAAYTTLNLVIPKSGLSSSNHLRLVKTSIKPVFEAFAPDALVIQCGVDGLTEDPCKEWNLDLAGYGETLKEILSWRKCQSVDELQKAPLENEELSYRLPTLLLGGGGYNSPNAARAWAYFTSIALGRPLAVTSMLPMTVKLPEAESSNGDRQQSEVTHIPETCEYWDEFRPSFTLDILPGLRRDENSEEDIQKIERTFAEYAAKLRQRK